MSLVAYDTSDEDSENEEEVSLVQITSNDKDKREVTRVIESIDEKLRFPVQGNERQVSPILHNGTESSDGSLPKVNFSTLPTPKSVEAEKVDIVEEDDVPPNKEHKLHIEKPAKKDRGPVKICIPSINDFRDLDEEDEKKPNSNKSVGKSSGLFAVLPPPKHENQKKKSLIPQVVSKTSSASKVTNDSQKNFTNASDIKINATKNVVATKVSLNVSHYDSNSDDEDEPNTNSDKTSIDFLGLNTNKSIDSKILDTSSSEGKEENLKTKELQINNYTSNEIISEMSVEQENSQDSNKTLVSNVMNLPKEEILLKNQAEVGPKLPIPEQEYHVDAEGNVAFDEKAIEYLCGKRGIKRKNKEIDEANIIEIKGDDIKPDEREWLVKALTEEPIHRPLSMHTSGVSSQSKKKHQITYLAHQAKAMEVELKNQWALNRMTRKQTQSKYGF